MNQSDLARWLLCILDKGVAGHAYNVGSDKAILISDLAYLVRGILNPDKKVMFNKAKSNFMGPNIYIPDISRAKRDLNLGLTVSLQESIGQFLEKKSN